MKKTIVAFAVAASFLASCNGTKSVNLEPVAEPSWYKNQALFEDVNGLYEEMPIYENNIVFVGDNIVADGLWNEFFNDTTIKNRGIRYDGTEHVLYRIDKIAAAKPAKIFVSVGGADAEEGKDTKEAAARIGQIFERISAISPETKSYYIGIGCGEKGDEINGMVKEAASNGKFEFIDISSMREKIENGEYTYNDGMNFNAAGYEALTKILAPYVGDTALNSAVEGKDGRASLFYSVPEKEGCFAIVGDGFVDNIAWNELFPFSPVVSRGVSGETIVDLKARIDELYADSPAKIFLMVGTNDFLTDEKAQVSDVWSRYEELVKEIRTNLPSASLYVHGLVPATCPEKPENFNQNVAEFNKLLEAGQQSYGYFFIDMASIVCDEAGTIAAKNTTDGLHFNANGYFIWAAELLKGVRMIGTERFITIE